MRYIELVGPIPRRKQTALNNRKNKVDEKLTVKAKKEYIKKTNTWGLLKNWLSELSDGKCWYCEASSERATADVDHFRPKAGVTCERNKLANHDGYYWLAYEWENYRYSCQRCNRPEKDSDITYGKHNEFALLDESQRKNNPLCTNVESPKLLDPCIEGDTELLAHLKNGEVAPVYPDDSDEYVRAGYTVKVLGLNQYGVPKKKRDLWEPIQELIELVGNNPRVIRQLEKKLSPVETEYSSFFRAMISLHRDKDWVDNLL
ncbi:hypothetical protein L1264_09340 [Pseudoalteromonas sp. APAL1]|uniref:hypothetical protein n=1 Tax=Pseudoalteromonas TaxID=53246 RepID=UPI0018F3074D|nr:MULTISPECIES: hypothetical protein [unclassified Pseudoalteromonas]MCF2920682.1 hypothetical protein [Pseudoalteromonas sp. APAL1]|tara:strand:+ start:4005 stop:4784 length:780 start_codon:yes stop_codon:yes gene_type:complete